MRSPWLVGIFCFGMLSLANASVKPTDLLQDPSAEQWKSLEKFSNSVTRSEFEERLRNVFDPTSSLAPFLKISDQQGQIFSQTNFISQSNPAAVVTFAPPSGELLPEKFATAEPRSSSQAIPEPTPTAAPESNSFFSWIISTLLPTATPTHAPYCLASAKLPLAGLRVVIEPADIGGSWGSMEDRSTLYPGFGRIQEGDLNLLVSKILSARLRELGAEVFVTRENSEPVSGLSVAAVEQVVPQVLAHHRSLLSKTFRSRTENVRETSPIYQRIVAEVLLTKNLEAKARAEQSREAMKPDITIVLQFDATSARHKSNFPRINRNILFVSGAYTAKEIASDPNQRLRLLTKVLQNVSPTEIRVAHAISKHLNETTGFPPVYYGNSWSTRSIAGDPYVVARNLLLSREHDGPVVVTEPYFMNQEETLQRLLAGDYEGMKIVAGKPRISIYREYANAVSAGLLDVFGK